MSYEALCLIGRHRGRLFSGESLLKEFTPYMLEPEMGAV
jgi:hypothetical protein